MSWNGPLTENLWKELKDNVHAWKPQKVNELAQIQRKNGLRSIK